MLINKLVARGLSTEKWQNISFGKLKKPDYCFKTQNR